MVQHSLQETGKTQKNLFRPFSRLIDTIYIYHLNIKHLSCTPFHYSMPIPVLNSRNFIAGNGLVSASAIWLPVKVCSSVITLFSTCSLEK